MANSAVAAEFVPDSGSASRLIQEMGKRLFGGENPLPALAKELRMTESRIQELTRENRPLNREDTWKLIRSAAKHGFFDLLPIGGMPSVSYDLADSFNLLDPPVGFEVSPPIVPLTKRRTQIAGHWVDFPIGLSASVLAANAKWIEFYARRGFDVLTYKTVRSTFHEAHPWPNWVFLCNSQPVVNTDSLTFTGYPNYWPDDVTTASMANSFGIASFAPDWWMEDVRRARNVVREGHQVLIVSIVASRSQTKRDLIDDFVRTALLAKKAGADIIEANFSCPNTPDDRVVGELYKSIETAAAVSRSLKSALGKTPLFVKIGYLPEAELALFVEHNKEHIDGIVAINTISASILNPCLSG